jgi:general secretion pathway protein H
MTKLGPPGFTLLELLVVLAIAGLMISIAMPFTVRTIENAELRADAREAVSDLRQLRQRAIDRQQAVEVAALSENAWPQAGRAIRHRAQFVAEGRARKLIFYPDGTSSGGRLRLREGSRSVDVNVAWLSGAITSGPSQ